MNFSLNFKLLITHLLLTFLLLNLGCASCAKILVVSVIPANSHQIVIQPIVKELSLKGHEVTFITPKPLLDNSLKQYREININFTEDILNDIGKTYLETSKLSAWMSVIFEDIGILQFILSTLEYEPIKMLIDRKDEAFDLIIFEDHHPLVYGYGGRFNCPMIGIVTHFADANKHFSVGNHYHPITNPDLRLGHAGRLTFTQRVHSVFIFALLRLRYNLFSLPYANMLAKKYFGDIPHLRELENNISLLFTSTHPLLDGIHANKPTVIELGKIKRLEVNQSLSKDLLDFINSADNGFVYFSLGSLLKSKAILSKKLLAIIKTFSEIPQKVVWTWTDDSLQNLSDNVKVVKWVSQELILKHPNCKVFMTAGGSNSIKETITAEIPVLTIPLQFDNFYFAEKVIEYGIGRTVDIDEFETNDLTEALTDLSTNPQYLQNIKKLKVLIEDRPVDGLEQAVWWIEYVIRHKGAKHLRSSVDNIPFYEYLMLDVALFLLTCFLIVYILIVRYFSWKLKLKQE